MSDDNTAEAGDEETSQDTPSSALASNDASDDNSADTNSDDNEYGYVPEKFMKDGQPDFENLAKSYTEVEKAFREKRGAESVDDYEYDLKNEKLFNEQMLPNLKEQALEWGMSGEQFSNVAGLVETIVSEQSEVFQEKLAEEFGNADRTEADLKSSWGNEYDDNMKLVDRAWNAYKPEGVSADSFTNDPNMYKMLARIGAELSEDHTTGASGITGEEVPTQAEIDELLADPRYWDQSSGIEEKAIRMMERRARANA